MGIIRLTAILTCTQNGVTKMPSYEQNKSSKLWSVRFREIDDTGESHQKRLSGYKTKKEAQYGYQDYLAQKAEEEKLKKSTPSESPEDMLFETLVAHYIKYRDGRVKDSTLYEIKTRVGSKILPYFSGKRLYQIKPVDVLNWQHTLSGFSYQYLLKLHNTLVSIYRYGYKYHNVTNIMEKVDRPVDLSPKKEMKIWSPEEFSKFYSAAEGQTFRLFFLTLYTTGMRRGECSALFWEDFDPLSSTLKIYKSITSKGKSKGWDITTPKNKGSNRTVTIPSFLRDLLIEYKKDHTDARFIFGDDRPLPSTTVDRKFKRTAEAAGLTIIRVHDLRHSCASLLISRGVSVVGVSHQLGHKDVEQTLNTYAHLMPDDSSRIVAELSTIGTLL